MDQNSETEKKGPLRGTPHNLSKVSLEVEELEDYEQVHCYNKQLD